MGKQRQWLGLLSSELPWTRMARWGLPSTWLAVAAIFALCQCSSRRLRLWIQATHMAGHHSTMPQAMVT